MIDLVSCLITDFVIVFFWRMVFRFCFRLNSRIKFPQCGYHHTFCTYVTLEDTTWALHGFLSVLFFFLLFRLNFSLLAAGFNSVGLFTKDLVANNFPILFV